MLHVVHDRPLNRIECEKWDIPTETISQKMDITTALIVEQWKWKWKWKRITSAA